MSKLKKLIQELCPDGVEYKKLGEIATISRGGNFQKKDFKESGKPCIHYGQIYTKYGIFADKTFTFISEECAKKQKKALKNDVVMAVTSENIEDVCKCLAWLGNDEVAISGHSAIIHHNQNAKYLAYYFHTEMFFSQKRKLAHGTKVVEVTPNDLQNVIIPVPPLPVQSEIVRILDNFTELTTKITTELIAEITARKTQYEYYRDTLLSKDKSVEKKTIGEITRVFSASRVHKEDWTTSGVPFFRSSDIISYFNGVENSRGKAFISHELYERLSAKSGKICKDDVLVTGGGTIGIPYVVPDNEPLYMKDADLICIQKTDCLNSRFLYHYFLSTPFRDYLKSITHDATIAHYTITQVMNTPIPLPSIEVQKRLVSVLDNFEAICSDLNIGLPAEIEARKKQYEFYRDALLTFAQTGEIITDRQTNEYNALIKLCQYVFGYVRIKLGTIGKVSMCKRIMKAETSADGEVPFFKIGTFGKEPDAYISREKFEEYKATYSYPNKGDILISAAGTIGRTVIFDGEPAYYQDSNIVWIANDESIVLNKYLYYCYQLQPWNISAGGTIARLYNDNITKAKIMVPSLREQKRIISILDRFDTLCNDLTKGLPAEIEARQKQYEYYRDKLLTFS